MATKTALPKSRAKTAYGLLSEIRRLILAEPKRYNQRDWLAKRHILSGYDFPACGTVACVAGWVTTLKAPRTPFYRVSPVAQRILGLSSMQELDLFGEDAACGEPQTREHAKSGAAHIASFQKRYAAQLKAKRV